MGDDHGQRPKSIELTPLGVYRTGFFDEGAVEISAYDPESHRAFMTFASQPKLDVVDVSEPANPVLAFSIDLTPWGRCPRHERRSPRWSSRGRRASG
jgi:hypothetical protein